MEMGGEARGGEVLISEAGEEDCFLHGAVSSAVHSPLAVAQVKA